MRFMNTEKKEEEEEKLFDVYARWRFGFVEPTLFACRGE